MSKAQEASELRGDERIEDIGSANWLQQQRDRFLAFAFASADVLVETGRNGKILFCAGATRPLLGRSGDECIGLKLGDLVAAAGKSFLKAIASLCNDLDLKTIGEMIENELAVRMLEEVHIPFGQGYVLGPPTETIAKVA